MWDAIQFILIIGGYVLLAYLIIKLIAKFVVGVNPYLRLLTLSFFYALFWGISIAATGGDPGFGFPAPNIVAITVMLSIGFYRGVTTGLYILGLWWLIIFTVMLIRQIIKRRRRTIKPEQQ